MTQGWPFPPHLASCLSLQGLEMQSLASQRQAGTCLSFWHWVRMTSGPRWPLSGGGLSLSAEMEALLEAAAPEG